MRELRSFLSWLFAVTAAICLAITAQSLWWALSALSGQGLSRIIQRLFIPTLFLALAFVFATAWWNVFRDTPSGGRWGLAASSIHILMVLLDFVLHLAFGHRLLRPIPVQCAVGTLIAGVVGVVVFLRRWPAVAESFEVSS
jgi:hypothetical protein